MNQLSMKSIFRYILSFVCLIALSTSNHAQVAPNLGTVKNFVLFSADGAVTMNTSAFSIITGDFGTGNPATTSTGFGNVNGNQHDGDAIGLAAGADLLLAYNELNAMAPTLFPASAVLGNGDTLIKGIYEIKSVASLNNTLYLDAKGDANAVFIIQIQGAFSSSANAKVRLINGAMACNVFWKVEGKIDLATGTYMVGTMIANNDEIVMGSGDTLVGRAFSTTGAITINKLFAYMPLGCDVPVLTGPTAPPLGATACFSLFATTGAVANTGVSTFTGDIGSNSTTAPTGFVAANVTGTIHLVADSATAQAASDLALAYTYLDTMPVDIQLMFPAQFGNNLVLTPHTYLLDAATTLIDTVVLNAQGNANAVFVIKINGALSTSVNSRVKLINGTQSNNVYWKVEGAVSINDNSTFVGTVIVNNGALGSLNTGVNLKGRLLTTNGAIATTALVITAGGIPSTGCGTGPLSLSSAQIDNASIIIYPNPFTSTTTIRVMDASAQHNYVLKVYNALGMEVQSLLLNTEETRFKSEQTSGVYFYRVIDNGQLVQSGKLVVQ